MVESAGNTLQVILEKLKLEAVTNFILQQLFYFFIFEINGKKQPYLIRFQDKKRCSLSVP